MEPEKKKEKNTSLSDVLNTEICALIEYAKMTGKVDEIDTDAVIDLLKSLVHNEIDQKYGNDPDKLEEAKLINARYDSDEVWYDVEDYLAKTFYGDDNVDFDKKSSLYDRGGSVSSLVLNNKRITNQKSGQLGLLTGDRFNETMYFIPMNAEQINKEAQKNNCSFEQAINILGTHTPMYLCHYSLKQRRKDGVRFIYGSLAGLKRLCGSDGILKRLGINGSLESGVRKQYRVVLDADSASTFEKMVANPTSPLFDYITETARLNDKEESTTFSGNSDDPEDNKSAQNKKELSTDNQESLQDMYDNIDYTEYEQSLQDSIDKVSRAIYAYNTLAKSCRLPSIPFNAAGNDIDKVNAITKYIVELGKSLGVEIKVITGRINGRNAKEVHIAKMNAFIRERMYKALGGNLILTHNPDIQKKVYQFLRSLLAFSRTVTSKIQTLYSTITFDNQPTELNNEKMDEETKPLPVIEDKPVVNKPVDDDADDYDDIMMMMQGNSML